eukprot:5981009-Prymnesium_polylepis.1
MAWLGDPIDGHICPRQAICCGIFVEEAYVAGRVAGSAALCPLCGYRRMWRGVRRGMERSQCSCRSRGSGGRAATNLSNDALDCSFLVHVSVRRGAHTDAVHAGARRGRVVERGGILLCACCIWDLGARNAPRINIYIKQPRATLGV